MKKRPPIGWLDKKGTLDAIEFPRNRRGASSVSPGTNIPKIKYLPSVFANELHALATLNSFVLALFDFCQVSNVKRYMRCLDADPLQAVSLLRKSLEEN